MDRQPRQVEFLMGTYSYSVARFVPDPIKNEPVNIGAIVVDQETGRTAHRFLRSMRGLAQRCPGADLETLEKILWNKTTASGVSQQTCGTSRAAALRRKVVLGILVTPSTGFLVVM